MRCTPYSGSRLLQSPDEYIWGVAALTAHAGQGARRLGGRTVWRQAYAGQCVLLLSHGGAALDALMTLGHRSCGAAATTVSIMTERKPKRSCMQGCVLADQLAASHLNSMMALCCVMTNFTPSTPPPPPPPRFPALLHFSECGCISHRRTVLLLAG